MSAYTILKDWGTNSSNASRTNKSDMLIDMCFICEPFPDSERSFLRWLIVDYSGIF